MSSLQDAQHSALLYALDDNSVTTLVPPHAYPSLTAPSSAAGELGVTPPALHMHPKKQEMRKKFPSKTNSGQSREKDVLVEQRSVSSLIPNSQTYPVALAMTPGDLPTEDDVEESLEFVSSKVTKATSCERVVVVRRQPPVEGMSLTKKKSLVSPTLSLHQEHQQQPRPSYSKGKSFQELSPLPSKQARTGQSYIHHLDRRIMEQRSTPDGQATGSKEDDDPTLRNDSEDQPVALVERRPLPSFLLKYKGTGQFGKNKDSSSRDQLFSPPCEASSLDSDAPSKDKKNTLNTTSPHDGSNGHLSNNSIHDKDAAAAAVPTILRATASSGSTHTGTTLNVVEDDSLELGCGGTVHRGGHHSSSPSSCTNTHDHTSTTTPKDESPGHCCKAGSTPLARAFGAVLLLLVLAVGIIVGMLLESGESEQPTLPTVTDDDKPEEQEQPSIAPTEEGFLATVSEKLCMEQVPGQGWSILCEPEETMEHGGDACNLIAFAFLDQVSTADLSIQHSGSCQGDIAAGTFSEQNAHDLLPYEHTLVTFQLTGQEILNVLEHALVEVFSSGLTGGYPYAAGLRFHVNATQSFGSRLSQVEVNTQLTTSNEVVGNGNRLDTGTTPPTPSTSSWVPIGLSESYTVVANSFMVAGGSGYEALHGSLEDKTDDGISQFLDTKLRTTDAFMAYAKQQKVLHKLSKDEYSTQSFVAML